MEYLTTTNGHHEYREQPLPAFAITFEHPTNTTVYVSSALGTVQKFRNNKWRIFDFLWIMLRGQNLAKMGSAANLG